jgi:hypothetical protein
MILEHSAGKPTNIPSQFFKGFAGIGMRGFWPR